MTLLNNFQLIKKIYNVYNVVKSSKVTNIKKYSQIDNLLFLQQSVKNQASKLTQSKDMSVYAPILLHFVWNSLRNQNLKGTSHELIIFTFGKFGTK